jgi:LacI family transcriptional regulator
MAILGVDNDPLYCESVAVPISSIQHDAISIGYQGAQQLDLLMRGDPSPPPKLIAPLGIELRRSTEQFFITNPDVLCALRFISEKYASNMGVDDVAAAVGRSRRTLQILFRKELGESIVDRIVKTRIAKAQELLTRSTKSMADVAKSSGFTSSSYFHRVFKASQGCTPVKYRQLTGGQS